MEYENTQKRFESVYSTKVRAGKRRTYFFDVRKTKGEDFYITLTESTKRFDSDGYERHKIFLYKEDFNRFLSSLGDAINHVKDNLMPDYDYDEFTRRQEEWEESRSAMDQETAAAGVAIQSVSKPVVEASNDLTAVSSESDTIGSPDDKPSSVLSVDPDSQNSDEDLSSLDEEEDVAQPAVEDDATSMVSEKTSGPSVSEEVNDVESETEEEDMSW